MKRLKTLRVLSVALTLLMGAFFAQPAMAATGDVDGDDIPYTPADFLYLFGYLFENGPPPANPIDAEVDLTAGINLGDVLQIMAVIQRDCLPIPEPYTGHVPSFSNIEFAFPVITPGGTEPFNVSLDLTDNPGPDLMGMVITFSYQHLPGHVGIDLNSVDFTGSIVPTEWETQAYVDSVNKRALLVLHAWVRPDPPLSSGTTGPVATLTFTRTENPEGGATFLSPTLFPPTNSPLLIAYYCPGPAGRVLIPKCVFGKNGDLNCDGEVNVADLGYLINYLFLGGSPPCTW